LEAKSKPKVKNILDDVFKKPEPEVRYFSEVMRTPVSSGAKKVRKSWAAQAASGKTDSIKAAVFTRQISGGVAIDHGFDGSDYVWHIEPGPRRQWKVTMDRVIYAIAKTMHGVIPDNVKVNIFKPYLDWEVKVVTFKAHGLGDCWNVTPKDITDLTLRLFEVLNPLV